MTVRLAASILFMLLPLALRAQTIGGLPDPYQSPGRTVVAEVEAGQRNMQREQAVEDRRRQREFDRREQLELMERQRELDRQQRAVKQQRQQLLQLQAQSGTSSVKPSARVAPTDRTARP